MRESTQTNREDFEKLLSAPDLWQEQPDSVRPGRFREKQGKEGADQHAEVLSKILVLRTAFELEQLNFEGAVQATVKFATETLQCSGAAMGLVEENHVRYCASSGRIPIRAEHMPLTTSPSLLCVESRSVFVSADVPKDERLPAIIRGIGWLRSFVVIPIFLRKDVGATLEIYFTESRDFAEKDINTYEVLGILIGKVLLTDAIAKITDELECERAETKARLEQLRPQLELLSGKTEISACDERDSQLPSPQDGRRIPQTTDRAVSSATNGPKGVPHKDSPSDQVLDSAVNSEFDPISALLITQQRTPTREAATVRPSGEMFYARTGSISVPVSPIATRQEREPETSKNRAMSRKDSARRRANLYLVFAGIVGVWSLFFQGHDRRVLPIFSKTEQVANKLAEDKVQPASRNGDPGATVWVDLKRFEYYCSDTQQYGRTKHGEFMAQSEAQLSQYQPNRHRTCE